MKALVLLCSLSALARGVELEAPPVLAEAAPLSAAAAPALPILAPLPQLSANMPVPSLQPVQAAAAARPLAASIARLDAGLKAVAQNPLLKPGDWVRAGDGQVAILAQSPFDRADGSDARPFDVVPVEGPAIGRVMRGPSDDHDVGFIVDGRFVEATLGRGELTLLRPRDATRQAVAGFETGTLSFQKGELVRYRDQSGVMSQGMFEASEKGIARVRTASGRAVSMPLRQIFKSTGEHAVGTPDFAIDRTVFRWAGYDPSKGLTRAFLDAAARLASHPDFLEADADRRLQYLVDFTRAVVEPDDVATGAERFGLSSFNDVLAAGRGVCRHLAHLFAAAASEAGYRVELALYFEPGEREGHAWLEVGGRDGRAFAVDPANDQVLPWSQVVDESADEGSLSRKWYAQKGRRTLPAQRLPSFIR